EKIEFHCQSDATMKHGAWKKARLGEERAGLLEISVDKDVFPRDQNSVKNKHRIVFIQPTRERVIKWTSHHCGRHRVRRPADELHSCRAHRYRADQCELLFLEWDSVVSDKVQMCDRRIGGNDFRATDDEAVIAFLFYMDKHISHFVRRPVSVDRWMNDGVVPVQNLFLRFAIPAPRVVLKRVIEVGVRPERSKEGGFVIWAASHPTIGDPCPGSDRIAISHKIFSRPSRSKKPHRVAAITGIGRARQRVASLRIVQRIVKTRCHSHGVAEAGVGGYILDSLPVEVDLSSIAEA